MGNRRAGPATAVILAWMLPGIVLAGSSNHAVGKALSHGCANPVFEDNFAGEKISRDKWNVLIHRKPPGDVPPTGLQNYTDETVSTGVNGLRIQIKRSENGEYTSGRIVSRQTFRYGRFEVSAKLPVGRGLWPAIWMRTPTNLPLNGEIDMVEAFGSDPSSIQSTLHPWRNGHEDRQYCVILKVRADAKIRRRACENVLVELDSDLSKEFHLYAVDWLPDRISWSIDGIQYYTVKTEIPDQPMSLIINLAISPLHDGAPDGSLKPPQYLSVKSVRVCPLGN